MCAQPAIVRGEKRKRRTRRGGEDDGILVVLGRVTNRVRKKKYKGGREGGREGVPLSISLYYISDIITRRGKTHEIGI